MFDAGHVTRCKEEAGDLVVLGVRARAPPAPPAVIKRILPDGFGLRKVEMSPQTSALISFGGAVASLLQ